MNLREKIQKRLIPIFAMKGFNDQEKTVALESIYNDFEKEGYTSNVIGSLISTCILEDMKESQKKLNLVLEHFKKR